MLPEAYGITYVCISECDYLSPSSNCDFRSMHVFECVYASRCHTCVKSRMNQFVLHVLGCCARIL